MTAPQPSRHALLGPSGRLRWRKCPGSIAMELIGKYDNNVGIHAAAGTFMHHVAAMCLEQHRDASSFFGHKEVVDGYPFEFGTDHEEIVQTYVDTVWTYVGPDGELWIEQELDISWLTGEPNAIGTADAVIVRNGELCVIDLKTGLNDVPARENEQLQMYALAALKAYRDGTLTRKSPPPVDDDVDDLL